MKINRFLQSGWTLIELLIVLAIVAILTAILVTSMIQPAMTRNNNQVLLNNVTALVEAAHSYRLAHTSYVNTELLNPTDGIVSYLNQDPNSALWQINLKGAITCPEGDNPSTCPTSINATGESSQQFIISIDANNNIKNVEGLLQQSGGQINENSGHDSGGFTVTYD